MTTTADRISFVTRLDPPDMADFDAKAAVAGVTRAKAVRMALKDWKPKPAAPKPKRKPKAKAAPPPGPREVIADGESLRVPAPPVVDGEECV